MWISEFVFNFKNRKKLWWWKTNFPIAGNGNDECPHINHVDDGDGGGSKFACNKHTQNHIQCKEIAESIIRSTINNNKKCLEKPMPWRQMCELIIYKPICRDACWWLQ